jgi:hypothetical protein
MVWEDQRVIAAMEEVILILLHIRHARYVMGRGIYIMGHFAIVAMELD